MYTFESNTSSGKIRNIQSMVSPSLWESETDRQAGRQTETDRKMDCQTLVKLDAQGEQKLVDDTVLHTQWQCQQHHHD